MWNCSKRTLEYVVAIQIGQEWNVLYGQERDEKDVALNLGPESRTEILAKIIGLLDDVIRTRMGIC